MQKKDDFNKVLMGMAALNKKHSGRSPAVWELKEMAYGVKVYKCSGCFRLFNLKTGTLLSRKKMTFRNFFKLVYLLTSTDLPQKDVAALCSTTRDMVRRFKSMVKGL